MCVQRLLTVPLIGIPRLQSSEASPVSSDSSRDD
ncbi:hypothetical protein AVEN_267994-1, partial [Araneus ventricosus]